MLATSTNRMNRTTPMLYTTKLTTVARKQWHVVTNNTVLELSRPATNVKDLSNGNNGDKNAKPKEWDNTNDIEKKLTTAPRKELRVS